MRATCVFVVASLITRSRADLRVGEAAGEQVEHLALARGQLVDRRWRRGRLGGLVARELLDHRPGDGGREQRLAVGDDPDGGCDFLGWCVFEHEPARAGPE